MLQAGPAWRSSAKTVPRGVSRCKPALARHGTATTVRASVRAGLFQVPGLVEPGAWHDVVQHVQCDCHGLVAMHLSGHLSLEATLSAVTNIMDAAVLQAAHAADHHTQPVWRQAAHGAHSQLMEAYTALRSALEHLAQTEIDQEQEHVHPYEQHVHAIRDTTGCNRQTQDFQDAPDAQVLMQTISVLGCTTESDRFPEGIDASDGSNMQVQYTSVAGGTLRQGQDNINNPYEQLGGCLQEKNGDTNTRCRAQPAEAHHPAARGDWSPCLHGTATTAQPPLIAAASTPEAPWSHEADWQGEVAQAEHAEAQLRVQLGRKLKHLPPPWLVLHANEVGEGDLADLTLHPVPLKQGGSSPCSLHGLWAGRVHCKANRQNMWSAPFYVRRQLGRGRRGKHAPDIVLLSCTKLGLRWSRGGCRKPALASRARRRWLRDGRRAGVTPAGRRRCISLPAQLMPASRGHAMRMLRMHFGASAYMTVEAENALVAWRRKQQGTPEGLQLLALQLTPGATTHLMRTHPGSAMRRAVYLAGVRHRVRAVAQAVEAILPLRQAIARLHGWPSYAHGQLADTSPGVPAGVSALMKDLALGLGPLVEEQLGAGAHLLQRSARTAGTAAQGCTGGVVLKSGDVDRACELLRAQQGPRQPRPWGDVATCFTLEGVLGPGLSRLLSPASLRVQVQPVLPGELWPLPQDSPQAMKLQVFSINGGNKRGRDLRAEGGPGGEAPCGLIYVVPDAASQPFTTLLRPGHVRLKGAEREETQPAAIIHLPLQGMESVQAHGRSLTMLRSPEMLQTLLHEVGHALSYCLSAREAASHGQARGCVCFSSPDVREIASHLVERCVFNGISLAALSSSTSPGCTDTGLTLFQARHLADSIATRYRPSPWDLQQHTLVALLDVALHAQSPATTPSSRLGRSSRQQLRLLSLMCTAWARNSSTGRLVLTASLPVLLEGLLLNPVFVWAYPMAQLLSSALWSRWKLGQEHAGWNEVRHAVLTAPGHARLSDMMAAALGAEGACREVFVRGNEGAVGYVPDLSHPAFQDIDF